MQRDADYLLDILQAVKAALVFLRGKTQADFNRDLQCQFAVVRAIEIIGEAANRVSQETCAAHPEIPWREMIAMRNRMIHDYDEVDLDIVWDTVHNDLPPLVERVEALLPHDSGSS